MDSFLPMTDGLKEKGFDAIDRSNLFKFYLLMNYLFIFLSITFFFFNQLIEFNTEEWFLIPVIFFYGFLVQKISNYDDTARLLIIITNLAILLLNLNELVTILNYSYLIERDIIFLIFNSLLPLISFYILVFHKETVALFRKEEIK